MRQVGIVALMLLVGAATFGGLIAVSPKYMIHAQRQTEFWIERDFEEIRKSLQQGRFEEEILKSNHATLLSKQWHKSDLRIVRPLSKQRYWEFNGCMTAKIAVDHPQADQIVVEMQHQLHVAKDVIDIQAKLAKPLPIGVTDLQQRITIFPDGPGRTKIQLRLCIKLQRVVPSFMRAHVQNELNAAADRSMSNIQQVLINLPTPKKGLIIPINPNR